jgi:shikimate dehydrogenase
VILDEVTAAEHGRNGLQGDDTPACLIGLVGRGIQRSKSPAMHQHEADALGLRCVYQLIDLNVLSLNLEDLPRVLEAAELMGFAGLNVTHPCKQAVIPLLDELSEDARAIGAVNTIRFKQGKRFGFNTDAYGFAESFRRGLSDVSLSNVVQIGAGGAGAATAYALLELGAQSLAIFDMDTGRASALTANLERVFGADRVRVAAELPSVLARARGIVQATPVGTREHPGMPLSASLLRSDLWVAEVVYFPLETQLLHTARALGCRTLDGGGMAVFQAAAAFEIFTGLRADGERMRALFDTIPGD